MNDSVQLFQNEQLDISALPKVADLQMLPLEERYKSVLLIGRSIFTLILACLVTAFYIIPPEDEVPMMARYIAIGLFIIYAIWGFIKTIKGFAHKAYALREKDIVYQTGWLWKETTTAPFNRVQHVSIDQGPIERQFDLAKLKIFTAGGKASDMSIPGLSPDTANELKEYIVKKTLEEEKLMDAPPLTFVSDEEQ